MKELNGTVIGECEDPHKYRDAAVESYEFLIKNRRDNEEGNVSFLFPHCINISSAGDWEKCDYEKKNVQMDLTDFQFSSLGTKRFQRMRLWELVWSSFH